jgi:hypothetical protein
MAVNQVVLKREAIKAKAKFTMTDEARKRVKQKTPGDCSPGAGSSREMD